MIATDRTMKRALLVLLSASPDSSVELNVMTAGGISYIVLTDRIEWASTRAWM